MRIKQKHEIIENIELAFASCKRPREFVTNPSHCEECAEHDNTLRNTDRERIGLRELGRAGWDPLCFASPQAFLYYFPSMVRLLFDQSANDAYLAQFLFHCTSEENQVRCFPKFSLLQAQATADLLRFMKMNWRKKIERDLLTETVDDAVRIWSDLETMDR